MNEQLSRRTFLGTTAATAIGASLTGCGADKATTASRAKPQEPGPNETINVGLVGSGHRGPYIALLHHIVPGVRVTALCDVHQGRIPPALEKLGKVTDTSKLAVHRDYRKLIDDKDIDVIVVASSIHWHVLPTIAACAAGKDVYLEKPVGFSIGEGRAAVDTARRNDRLVQMGTQQHSWEHYIKAVEIIRSGLLGEISNVHVWDVCDQSPGLGAPPDGPPPPELDWDFYLGPAPVVPYNPNRYRYHDLFFDYGGAWQLAWGVHHFDVVHWAMGVDAPVTASGMGGRFAFSLEADNREWPDTFNGSCEYPPGPVARNGFLMTYTGRAGCGQPIMGCVHGKAFYGTEGVLVIDRLGYTIYSQHRDGRKLIPEERMDTTHSEHEVVMAHVRSFVDCLRNRRQPVADINVGHRATNPGHLMNIAWRVGRRIRWDPQQERVLDDAEADAFATRHYLAPWRLPT